MLRLLHLPFVILLLAYVAYAETKVVITGSQLMTSNDIRDIIGDRFTYVEMKPASPARAADAAFMVEQVIRQKGFNDAIVSWKILNPQTIRLTVNEGPRDLLGRVKLWGVPDQGLSEELVDLFRLPVTKRHRALDDILPMVDGDVEQGLKYMEVKMESLGYWDAVAKVDRKWKDEKTGRMNFLLNAELHEIHRIGRPRLPDNAPRELGEITIKHVGRLATTTNINNVRSDVEEFYRKRGFVNSEIRTSIEEIGELIVPAFDIQQGEQHKLGEIRIEGLNKTLEHRVRNRFVDLQGKYIDEDVYDQRIRKIISTGAFSSLRSEFEPGEDGSLNALLKLNETKARGVSLSLGYDTYEEFLFGASYYDRNFTGRLLNLNAGFEVSARSLLGEVSLTDPWAFGTDMSGGIRLFALNKSREGYDNLKFGIEGNLSRSLNEHMILDLTAGWAHVSTSADGIPIAALGETDYGHLYLRFTPVIDYRDSKILPTTGWHAEFPIEIGAATGDLSTHYFKTEAITSWHQPLGKGQLSAGLRGGLIVMEGGAANLPIDIRFFNGGARSVRSFRERELGPRAASNDPVGGLSYWTANLEYSRPILGAIEGVVFTDAGGLSRDWEDRGRENPEVALGLGLRYPLPVGSVRFEYGHNLTRDPGEPSGTFHFAIGTAF